MSVLDIGCGTGFAFDHLFATFKEKGHTCIGVDPSEGCIVNAKYPSPVAARHVVGMYTSMPVLKALHQVVPERVVAEGSGAGPLPPQSPRASSAAAARTRGQNETILT